MYIYKVYTLPEAPVAETERAKLFRHGGSQAVRLPKEFRLPGTEVRVRRLGRGVLLEPLEFDVAAWLEALGRYKDVPFMEEGREQPPMPEDDVSFDK
jgi:antitoxin VapB